MSLTHLAGEDAPPPRFAPAAFAPELALLATIGLWSSTFVITKDALDDFSPLAFIFVRFGLMSLLAFCVLGVQTRRGAIGRRLPLRSDLPRFLAAGITGYTLYQLGFVLSLDRTSVFASSLLIATVPLFTMLFLTLLGERPPALAWAGVGIALAGVAVFLLEKRGGDRSATGDLLAIGAAVAFALYGIVNRPLARQYPPATYTAYTMAIGTIPLLLLGLPAASQQNWRGLGADSWIAVAYMVVFPVYVAYMLWNYAIAQRGAAVASSFGLLTPILSGALSAVVFHERFGAAKIAGAALVLTGLVVIRLAGSRPASAS